MTFPRWTRIVATYYWGRSGSLLLTSFLDGHDDIAMLPVTRGPKHIYQFFQEHSTLSLRNKLITYPIFSGRIRPAIFLRRFPGPLKSIIMQLWPPCLRSMMIVRPNF